MNSRFKSLASQLLIVTLASAFCSVAVAQDQDPCDRGAKTIKLKIKERNNKPTKVTKGLFGADANTIKACRGDTIQWKLSNKTFLVSFPNETPFKNKKKTSANGKIEMMISADAKRKESYKYDVGIVDGGTLDPIIIID